VVLPFSSMPSVEIFGTHYSAAKAYRRGTHRVRSPADTVAQYRTLMPKMGITRLANVTGLDSIGIPVYVAIRPNSRSLATSQGKGLDHDSARASALMESIETWHSEFMVNPLRWESHQALAREHASGETAVIDPRELPHFRAPALEAPQPWVQGWDVANGEACWVPLDAVTMNSVGTPEGGTELLRSSNGLSSGNHMLEAIVHGLCEVIERDAEALWRIGGELRQVDLTAVPEPYCAEVIERVTRAGAFLAAWDLTNDVGVPVYGCAILEPPDAGRLRSIGVHYGFGSHLSPAVALSRALTEAVQTRLTYISGSRDDFTRVHYQQNRDPELVTAIWEEITGNEPNARLDDRPSRATDTFEDDLSILVAAVRSVGVRRVVVVDLSRPEIGLPVVKVVVPGLEGPGGHLPGARARAALEAQARDGADVDGEAP